MLNRLFIILIGIAFVGCGNDTEPIEVNNELAVVKENEEVIEENYAITDKYMLQIFNENLSWAPSVLRHSGIKINDEDYSFIIESFLDDDLKNVEEKIKELSVMFADTSNTTFLINQLDNKTDSIIDKKVFEGFSNKDLYKIIASSNGSEIEKDNSIIYQMSNIFGTKTGGLVFVVTHCWVNDIKKEWLSAFKWSEENSKYEIYLAIGLDERNDLSLEFSKDGFK